MLLIYINLWEQIFLIKISAIRVIFLNSGFLTQVVSFIIIIVISLLINFSHQYQL